MSHAKPIRHPRVRPHGTSLLKFYLPGECLNELKRRESITGKNHASIAADVLADQLIGCETLRPRRL